MKKQADSRTWLIAASLPFLAGCEYLKVEQQRATQRQEQAAIESCADGVLSSGSSAGGDQRTRYPSAGQYVGDIQRREALLEVQRSSAESRARTLLERLPAETAEANAALLTAKKDLEESRVRHAGLQGELARFSGPRRDRRTLESQESDLMSEVLVRIEKVKIAEERVRVLDQVQQVVEGIRDRCVELKLELTSGASRLDQTQVEIEEMRKAFEAGDWDGSLHGKEPARSAPPRT